MNELYELLDKNGYSYYIEDDITIINHKGFVSLHGLTTLDYRTKFDNQSNVYLDGLTTLDYRTKFDNQGSVILNRLTTLDYRTKFSNKGHVWLWNLTELPDGIEWNTEYNIYLNGYNRLNKEEYLLRHELILRQERLNEILAL